MNYNMQGDLTQHRGVQRDELITIMNILPESNDLLEVLIKIHQERKGFPAFIINIKTVNLHPLMSRWDVPE